MTNDPPSTIFVIVNRHGHVDHIACGTNDENAPNEKEAEYCALGRDCEPKTEENGPHRVVEYVRRDVVVNEERNRIRAMIVGKLLTSTSPIGRASESCALWNRALEEIILGIDSMDGR